MATVRSQFIDTQLVTPPKTMNLNGSEGIRTENHKSLIALPKKCDANNWNVFRDAACRNQFIDTQLVTPPKNYPIWTVFGEKNGTSQIAHFLAQKGECKQLKCVQEMAADQSQFVDTQLVTSPKTTRFAQFSKKGQKITNRSLPCPKNADANN